MARQDPAVFDGYRERTRLLGAYASDHPMMLAYQDSLAAERERYFRQYFDELQRLLEGGGCV